MSKNTVSQMHIEAARNSTDDFNLFHDKKRWQMVENNPFGGAIALGFQLACFIESNVKDAYRALEEPLATEVERFRYSIYELTFAGVVKPGDELSLNLRKGRLSETDGSATYSSRLALKANDKPVLLGFKRDSDNPLIQSATDVPPIADINDCQDRQFCGNYFVKRKFMIVGNAKNFLTSAFAEQSEYIDEFIDKVSFPESYPLSLISSALLERAQAVGHDLMVDPMIYTSQKLSIDKTVLSRLKSNDRLSILVKEGENSDKEDTVHYYCIALMDNADVLFQAQLTLLPLSKLNA